MFKKKYKIVPFIPRQIGYVQCYTILCRENIFSSWKYLYQHRYIDTEKSTDDTTIWCTRTKTWATIEEAAKELEKLIEANKNI